MFSESKLFLHTIKTRFSRKQIKNINSSVITSATFSLPFYNLYQKVHKLPVLPTKNVFHL